MTFNNAYKKGNTRAGCLVCPMSQGKHDYMKYKNYPDDTDLFINKIITTSGKTSQRKIMIGLSNKDTGVLEKVAEN